MFRTLKVFDAERIDCNDLYTRLVANFENLGGMLALT